MKWIIFKLFLIIPALVVGQASGQGSQGGSSDQWVLFISMLVFFTVWVFISGTTQSKLPANELMKDSEEKFKRGEISKEEYESRKRDFE